MTKKNTQAPPLQNVVETTNHPDGGVWSKTPFVNGKQHGVEIWWYSHGAKSWEIPWKDGERHGVETQWHYNGAKQQETMWVDGKKHGNKTEWYRNGSIRKETMWVDGKKNGLETAWGSGGVLVRKTTWWDDKKHGLETEWDNDGTRNIKSREQMWWGGKKHGATTWWSLNIDNTKIAAALCRNDKRHGVETQWREDGTKGLEISFANDKEYARIKWDEEGYMIQANFPTSTEVHPPIPKSRLITRSPLKPIIMFPK